MRPHTETMQVLTCMYVCMYELEMGVDLLVYIFATGDEYTYMCGYMTV